MCCLRFFSALWAFFWSIYPATENVATSVSVFTEVYFEPLWLWLLAQVNISCKSPAQENPGSEVIWFTEWKSEHAPKPRPLPLPTSSYHEKNPDLTKEKTVNFSVEKDERSKYKKKKKNQEETGRKIEMSSCVGEIDKAPHPSDDPLRLVLINFSIYFVGRYDRWRVAPYK